LASCSTPGRSTGHAPRFREGETDLFLPGPEKWTCSLGPGFTEGRTHGLPDNPRDMLTVFRTNSRDMLTVSGRTRRTCSFSVAPDGHIGIMPSARAERWTCSVGPGCTGEHAHAECREWGMSSMSCGQVATVRRGPRSPRPRRCPHRRDRARSGAGTAPGPPPQPGRSR